MDNSKIHYRYIISYLLLSIVLLLALSYYQVPDLVDKLSFALTLSSLLLAILAIFYTIVSAHKQDSQLSRLVETHSDLKAAAKEIKTVSENLNTTLDDFPSHFKKIGSKIDDLAEKYSSLSPEKLSAEGKTENHSRIIQLSIDKDILFKMIGNLHFSAMAVLYLFSQASLKNKNIDFTTFNSLNISSTDYALGFLNGFETTGLVDFKIYQNALIPTRCDEIIYKELRPLLESVIGVIREDQAELLKARMARVDDFIA